VIVRRAGTIPRPVRFLLSGAVNTGLTYLLYLGLLLVVPPAVAYTLAFVAGIALAYALSRAFVFQATGTRTTAALFPLVYVLQYLVSVVTVSIWVDVLHLDARLAPAVAIALTLPITYVLSRRLFLGRRTVG
jgi:putative flippase GtrA